MIARISHITLYTLDQERAARFYVDKVGFKIHTDVMFGEVRVLTLCLPNQPELELVIMKATKPESQALVGKQSPEAPLIVLATDDCKADAAILKQKGISFTQEPQQVEWGIEALFNDPDGNLIDLIQENIS